MCQNSSYCFTYNNQRGALINKLGIIKHGRHHLSAFDVFFLKHHFKQQKSEIVEFIKNKYGEKWQQIINVYLQLKQRQFYVFQESETLWKVKKLNEVQSIKNIQGMERVDLIFGRQITEEQLGFEDKIIFFPDAYAAIQVRMAKGGDKKQSLFEIFNTFDPSLPQENCSIDILC